MIIAQVECCTANNKCSEKQGVVMWDQQVLLIIAHTPYMRGIHIKELKKAEVVASGLQLLHGDRYVRQSYSGCYNI